MVETEFSSKVCSGGNNPFTVIHNNDDIGKLITTMNSMVQIISHGLNLSK